MHRDAEVERRSDFILITSFQKEHLWQTRSDIQIEQGPL